MTRTKQDQSPVEKMLNPVAPCPASRAHSGVMWAPKSLGIPDLMAMMAAAHEPSFLIWLYLLPAAFLDINFMSLACPTSWSLHCILGFTLIVSHVTLSRGPLEGFQPCYTLPGFPDLPLKSWQKPPWHCNSWILHACRANIMWMMLRSAASSSGIQVHADHGHSSF
jgi:hypothetical protein